MGRPLLLSRFGSMDIQQVFSDVEQFVRYRVQVMEKAMSKLSFKKDEPGTLCQIHDYSGVPLSFGNNVRSSVKAVSKILEQHYPETKGKTVFVNFPPSFVTVFNAFAVFIPERTKSKFLILGFKDHETLFKLIAPENVPDFVGGMCRRPPGPLNGPCTAVWVRPKGREEVRGYEATESCTVAWELRVCFDDIAYEVVFVPEGSSDNVIVQANQPERLALASEGIVFGTWETSGAGSLIFRLSNTRAWFRYRYCLCRAGRIENCAAPS